MVESGGSIVWGPCLAESGGSIVCTWGRKVELGRNVACGVGKLSDV